MKTHIFQKTAMAAVVAGLIFAGTAAWAQQTATSSPQMPYGVSQVLQLSQAKVSDDTIVAYVKNSGNSYGLNADQIIYLRQQGISDAVVTAMLNQPRAGLATSMAAATSVPTIPTPTTPAPSMATADTSTATVAPSVTYVQPASTTYVYSSYPVSYPVYSGYYYPPVSLSLGFGWVGGRYCWGGGYHGGYYGGWHGGGGYHGGGGWHH